MSLAPGARAIRLASALLALALLVPGGGLAGERFGPPNPPQYHRDRVADIEHVAVDLTVDVRAGTVAGHSTVTMTLLRPSREIVLDAAEMTIEKVLSGPATLEHRLRGDQLSVRLPAELPAGRKLEVVVHYHASPRRGLYFVRPERGYPDRPLQAWSQGESEDNRYWFPSYDFPDDRFTTEVRATVRRPLVAVSNGRLLGVDESREGWRSYHWKQSVPHVNYLVTLTVGEFERVEVPGHRVKMAAWLTRRDLPHWERSFARTGDMMTFFEELTGEPYPWERYDQIVVDDFLYGGMENTGATTLTSDTIHDERAALDFSSDLLVAHELAHQWFGDLLTCRSWAHLWLNEGFATYAETLWLESAKTKDDADWDRVGALGWYLHAGYTRRLDENRFAHPDDLFDGHSYVKGAWVLHMLRVRLGDALFRRGVQHYVRRHRNGLVESDDLRRAFEEATGHELRRFFEQWVYRAGHPELEVTWSYDAEARQARVHVRQTATPLFELTIPVVMTGEFGVERFTLKLNREDQDFSLALPSEPAMVEIDPDRSVLGVWDIDKPVWEWAYQLEHGSSAVSRHRAARELADFDAEQERSEAVQALIVALAKTGEFHAVRAAAASSAGKLGTTEARAALIGALSTADSRVRTAAAEALGSFEHDDARDALERAFESDRSYYVAAAAVVAYVEAGGDDPLDIIDDALDRGSHREVIRTAGAQALGVVATQRAFRRLVKETAWGRPSKLRRAAVGVIATMGRDRPAFRVLARERLERLLADPRYWVRHEAVAGLETIGDAAAIPALTEMLPRATTRRMRRTITEAVAKLQSKQAGSETGELRGELEALQRRARRLEERLIRLEEAN